MSRILIVHDGKILGIEEPDTPANPFAYPGEARACPEAMAAAAPWLYDAAKAALARIESDIEWGAQPKQRVNEGDMLRAAIAKATSPLPSAERR